MKIENCKTLADQQQITEQAVSTISAMLQQEEVGYRALSGQYVHVPKLETILGSNEKPVDSGCRDKMVAWCFQASPVWA